jgi:hns-dependent expression protein A (HdeA).
MSTVTCEQLAGMNEDEVAWYLVWLDGWLAGQADDTMLDVEALGAQIDGIAKECQENPAISVINAAKKYLDE